MVSFSQVTDSNRHAISPTHPIANRQEQMKKYLGRRLTLVDHCRLGICVTLASILTTRFQELFLDVFPAQHNVYLELWGRTMGAL
jgi:hypothetical protein